MLIGYQNILSYHTEACLNRDEKAVTEKPMIAMQKASSSPLRKTTIKTSKLMMPIAVSPIFPPEDFHDIAEEYYAFKKTTNPNSIEHRVKWNMTGVCYLSGLGQIHAKDYHIPPDEMNRPIPKHFATMFTIFRAVSGKSPSRKKSTLIWPLCHVVKGIAN